MRLAVDGHFASRPSVGRSTSVGRFGLLQGQTKSRPRYHLACAQDRQRNHSGLSRPAAIGKLGHALLKCRAIDAAAVAHGGFLMALTAAPAMAGGTEARDSLGAPMSEPSYGRRV